MKTILTGIKPSGTPHVGNFFGAIKPAITQINATRGARSLLFIADYHALTTVRDSGMLRDYVRELACVWLACGLDPKTTIFYRQSDVPEIFELATIISNITPKGLLNRAHAFKAATDSGADVNMGLFNYPVLMSADILAFDTNYVPVGQDQKQHVEITADIAGAFNAVWGQTLTIPEPRIEKAVAIIPGLDGRKMSKSYGNQIPLFAPAIELKKHIMRITTDSSEPSEPKPLDHPLMQLYTLFATPEEANIMRTRFANGVGWGTVKSELVTVAERTIAPMRAKFEYYIANYGLVEDILRDGAKRARAIAKKTLKRVRIAVGAN